MKKVFYAAIITLSITIWWSVYSYQSEIKEFLVSYDILKGEEVIDDAPEVSLGYIDDSPAYLLKAVMEYNSNDEPALFIYTGHDYSGDSKLQKSEYEEKYLIDSMSKATIN